MRASSARYTHLPESAPGRLSKRHECCVLQRFTGEQEAGGQVFSGQTFILREDLCYSRPVRQQVQKELDAEARSANGRLSGQDGGI